MYAHCMCSMVYIHVCILRFYTFNNVMYIYILYLSGDSLRGDNGGPFSTYDRDNSGLDFNCAERHKGASWFKVCYWSNLNGLYLPGQSNFDSANWYTFNNGHVGLKFIEMKMRLQ